MALDPGLVRAEAALRHGFACAGDGLGDEMVAAFAELSNDEHTIAFQLARRVIIEALTFARPEGMSDEEFESLSDNIATTMSWANLESRQIQTFLGETWHHLPASSDHDEAYALAVICGGYLIIGLAPDGDWPTFLDNLLDRIIPPQETELPSNQ